MLFRSIIKWLTDCTISCKNALGDGTFISHAPQSPYFGPIGDSTTWAGILGGYTLVDQNVGNLIDFYNIQFYNQGETCYTTYDGLFNKSCSNFPQTSVAQISNAGINLNKLVVGKPLLTSDASNGYVDPTVLGQWFVEAQSNLGWNAGVMTWQWHNQDISKSWLQAIYPPLNLTPSVNVIHEIYGYRCNKKRLRCRK